MQKTCLFLLFSFGIHCLPAQSWFTSGQNADLMLSGVDFNQTGGPYRYNHPSGMASDGVRFLLCDRFNNRILVWNTAPASWDAPPDLVLGQPDFSSNNPGAGKHQLNWAGNASLSSGGKLAVADTENDRILLWNSFPTYNAQPADVSLYLPGYSPAGAAQPFGWPWGAWTDGTRLAAVATSGGAILFWNTFPTADNTPPDYILQLPQFGTPRNISTDGSTYFFVGDHNAKVNNGPGTFFWNSYPTSSNQPYDFYRDEWIKGEKLPGGQLVAGGLSAIYIWNTVPVSASQNPDLVLHPPIYKNGDGVDVLGVANRLYVNNYNGNNVLVFNDLPVSADQLPDYAVGSPGIYAQTLDSIHYIQNPVLASDGVRLIATSDFDRTINIWNNFPNQSGQKPDQRIAVPPSVHIWANACYNNTFVIAGRKTVSIWEDVAQLSATPSVMFNNAIGSAAFTDLSGVALDGQFLYLADKSGKIYGWKGIPGSANENPVFTISNPGVQYGFLHSDGQYLCAVKSEPPSTVYVYKVAELAAGISTPYKTIASFPPIQLNQASHAVTFGQSLAIASRGSHAVYLWKDLADAGDVSKMVVLGQTAAAAHDAAIGENRLFMPAALLAAGNSLWVGEFKFSSRILRFTSGTTASPEAPAWETDLSVYPNPVRDVFTLRLLPASTGAYSIDFLDKNGRLLHHLTGLQLHQGAEYRQTFSAGALGVPAGMFFVRVASEASRGVVKVTMSGLK